MENQGQSYGGSYSGTDFDFMEFIKRPLTICRLLCIVSFASNFSLLKYKYNTYSLYFRVETF